MIDNELTIEELTIEDLAIVSAGKATDAFRGVGMAAANSGLEWGVAIADIIITNICLDVAARHPD